METFSALLALCAGNSPVTGEFLAQRPVTRSFDGFFYRRLNKSAPVHNREVDDLRRHRTHYNVTVMDHYLFQHYVPQQILEFIQNVYQPGDTETLLLKKQDFLVTSAITCLKRLPTQTKAGATSVMEHPCLIH